MVTGMIPGFCTIKLNCFIGMARGNLGYIQSVKPQISGESIMSLTNQDYNMTNQDKTSYIFNITFA
jgi:hypothetical protein